MLFILGHTLSYAVFGLGMLWIAFLVMVYLLLLEFNHLTFVSLGFTGSTFKKFGESSKKEISSAHDYEKVNPAPSVKNGHYEMVQMDEQKSSGEERKEADSQQVVGREIAL
jgi:hypothetical protein